MARVVRDLILKPIYDSMDRLATRTDPLLRKEIYQYDLNGNLIQFSDRKSQISRFGYDFLNRRMSSIFDDGSKLEFVYDAVGRLTSVTDTVSGPISFSYDSLDRLVSEATPQGMLTYSYDAIGRRTSMSANGGTPIAYSYDSSSRLTQVAQGTQVVGLGYDGVGRRTSLTYPNGVATSYTYDQASRLTNIVHQGQNALIESLTYAYDAAGNRISFSRTGPQAALPAPVQAAYDAANQMSTQNSELKTQNLSYDANGNLISQTDARGTTTYSWDARNRLVSISGPGVSASFVYDALGRRVSKTINSVSTDYQYDGNDIVAEIGGGVVGATYLRSLNIDEPFVRQSSTNEYFHTDALGSVLGLTTETGQLVTAYSYDPFGNTTTTGTSANPFQYTGRENDQPVLSGVEGGLYYYRARYYSPSLKRFISQDPIKAPILPFPIELQNATLCSRNADSVGPFLLATLYQEPQRAHSYLYINNNPLRTGDPLGFGPSSECDFYAVECAKKTIGSYPCTAWWACRAAALYPGGLDCMRNCVMSKYIQEGCDGWACQFTGGNSGAGGAHGDCARCCINNGRKDGGC
ncbi:MAG: RHS repeat protein [Nitrospirae bacterium]|nr:RHS repeat protein [Nitrospirota bacterium]